MSYPPPFKFFVRGWKASSETSYSFGPCPSEKAAEKVVANMEAAGYTGITVDVLNSPLVVGDSVNTVS